MIRTRSFGWNLLVGCLWLGCGWGLPVTVWGQGALEPASGPAPIMKTLDQVEPRSPVDSTTTLSAPGSYYVTGNIIGTITIASSHVTLDLMGFEVRSEDGSAGAGDPAILVDGPFVNVVIRNGTVSSLYGDAIDATAGELDSMGRIESIRVTQAGRRGIAVENGYVVENCFVQGASTAGIWIGGNATVMNNTLTGNNTGLYMSSSPMHPAQNAHVEANRVDGNVVNYQLQAGNTLHLLLSEIPIVIDVPCRVTFASDLYMPTTPVTPGITIASDDVTIDMAGFRLIGPGEGMASASAIVQSSGWRNLYLKNGTVQGWMGSAATTEPAVVASGHNSRIEDLTSVNNRGGFLLGLGAFADRIHAISNSVDGIRLTFDSVIQNSGAWHNGQDGFATLAAGSLLESCTSTRNGRHGFYLPTGGILRGCVAVSNAESGFRGDAFQLTDSMARRNHDGVYVTNLDETHGERIGAGTVIRNSYFVSNYQYGIRLWSHGKAEGNTITQSGFWSVIDGIGLLVEGDHNQLSGNTLFRNQEGVRVTGAHNILTGNRITSSDELNWDIAASNVCFVVEGMTGGAFSGNSGGTGVGTFDPHANFTF